MPLTVYLAGRTEDLEAVRTMRDRLLELGIRCTSQWLNPGGINLNNQALGAAQCIHDITRADALVLVNLEKIHRTGTGGRHTEVGIALMLPRPVIVYGERENVFHHHPAVSRVPRGTSMADLAEAIRDRIASAPQRPAGAVDKARETRS
jgi:nucleoside 2-deoxyribosyltransferase